MKTKLKQQLSSMLGDRVTFNPTELIFYSHDIAAMPKLVKPMVGSTIPEAVAQPETEQEVIELMKWANRSRIPGYSQRKCHFRLWRGTALTGWPGDRFLPYE
ncbi:MAG: hypothetical protein U5N58_01405 [Actinomycetota bacterium]|nr:hypothetical protein [Actinomycetota bacterium]